MQTGTNKEPRERRTASSITLPPATWETLRKMALERTSSISRVLEALVEREVVDGRNRDQT